MIFGKPAKNCKIEVSSLSAPRSATTGFTDFWKTAKGAKIQFLKVFGMAA